MCGLAVNVPRPLYLKNDGILINVLYALRSFMGLEIPFPRSQGAGLLIEYRQYSGKLLENRRRLGWSPTAPLVDQTFGRQPSVVSPFYARRRVRRGFPDPKYGSRLSIIGPLRLVHGWNLEATDVSFTKHASEKRTHLGKYTRLRHPMSSIRPQENGGLICVRSTGC